MAFGLRFELDEFDSQTVVYSSIEEVEAAEAVLDALKVKSTRFEIPETIVKVVYYYGKHLKAFEGTPIQVLHHISGMTESEKRTMVLDAR